jgi:site-specific DNA recombinase
VVERGIIYGRASRDPKGLGTSVDSQIAECQIWADSEGIDVVHVVRDDNRSASATAKRAREGFQEVLRLVRAGAGDILIVWEASRSARDLEAFVKLRKACRDAGVAYAYKGRRYDLSQSDDAFRASLDALLAEREATDIRDRNLRTVRRNAEKGRPHGRLPYGYRRVYDQSSGALVAQTPYREGSKILLPEAQVLHDAVHALLSGVTLRQVCRDLNASGVPSPRKPRKVTLEQNPAGVVTQWEPSTLRQMVKNPTIAGRRVHRGEDVGPADWDPIVDYSTWLRLRSLLDDPARLTVSNPRGPAPRHLLSGIATCGECGARMKAATNLSRMPRAYTCRAEGCMKVIVAAERVDERVEAVLLATFARPDFRAALSFAYRRRRDAADKVPDVASLIAEKEGELAEVDVLRDEGALTLRAYAAETKRIEEAIEALRSKQSAVVTSLAVRRLIAADTLERGWKDAGLVDRRDIVRTLLDITVKRATVKGRRFDPDRLVIEPSDFLRAEVVDVPVEDFGRR